jgi:hypothetical protein
LRDGGVRIGAGLGVDACKAQVDGEVVPTANKGDVERAPLLDDFLGLRRVCMRIACLETMGGADKAYAHVHGLVYQECHTINKMMDMCLPIKDELQCVCCTVV